MLNRFIQKYPIVGAVVYAGYTAFDLKNRRDEYKKMQANTENDGEAKVFLWPMDTGSQTSDDGSVGHMAVQFDDKYASIWPKKPANATTTMYLTKILSADAHFASLREDIAFENRKPADVLIVRGLNKKKMHEKYEQLKQEEANKKLKFRVFYNFPFFNNQKTRGLNCAAAVNEILEAGGFPVKRHHVTFWGSSPVAQFIYYQFVGAQSVADKKIIKSIVSEEMKKSIR